MDRDADTWEWRRAAMLREIQAQSGCSSEFPFLPAIDSRVIDAMAALARHRFVPATLRRHAYDNRPLPIGSGQTISQPFIVALMTSLLDLQPRQKVLDVGTGSGYQAAVLAAYGVRVFTVELLERLARRARRTLQSQGLDDVESRCADGRLGWPERAPFDAIVISAAADDIPVALVEQLKVSGRLVMPLQREAGNQDLILVEKTGATSFRERSVIPVAFVPLRQKGVG